MPQPIILAVVEDTVVLARLATDLHRRYEDRFRIRVTHSPSEAVGLVAHLGHGDRVALIIVDMDLESMMPSALLDSIAGYSAGAARLVLRRFDDEAAAVDAVTNLGATRSVAIPWEVDTDLYPALDDVLDDWTAAALADARSFTIVGHRWAPHTHAVKDFLGRNHISYRWLDLDRGRHAAEFLEAHAVGPGARLPVVVPPSGDVMCDPTVEEVATALGMHTRAANRFYELAIVGGGPAGLAAAVYGGSEGLSTVLIEREAAGGQAGTSSRIDNYLGFPAGISGADLARRALTQTEKFGVEVLAPQSVARLELAGGYKVLTLGDGSSISCRALIVATGVTYRELHTPGLERLAGAGVYYGAATTEAMAAAGEHVYVVGSANSAGQGAVYFSRFAARVTIVFTTDRLADHMSQYLVDQITATDNIDLRPSSHVVEATGEGHLERLRIENTATGETDEVDASLLFIFVGAEPRNEWLGGLLAADLHGYLLCGPDLMVGGLPHHGWPLARDPFHLESSVPGVFVAGDARHGSIRRVAGAVGEGSTCVQLVHRYLAADDVPGSPPAAADRADRAG